MQNTLVATPTVRSTPVATMEPTVPFGMHLTLDGYGCSAEKLGDMDRVFEVLDQAPEALGMKKIITPYVVKCGPNEKKDPGGYSGFVMIAESHISVHTFPAKHFVSIDVYTCQGDLDAEKAKAIFQEAFGVKEFEENIIRRGTKYESS
jgi:S-adenosylmethionine decarboxylase